MEGVITNCRVDNDSYDVSSYMNPLTSVVRGPLRVEATFLLSGSDLDEALCCPPGQRFQIVPGTLWGMEPVADKGDRWEFVGEPPLSNTYDWWSIIGGAIVLAISFYGASL